MGPRRLHAWDVTPEEAIRLQRELADRVRTRDTSRGDFRLVAGMDVSYDKGSPWIFAAIVVLRLPDLAAMDAAAVRTHASFPYVPGLLSFREGPAGLLALARLKIVPDCLICDGHGLAHPRRLGLASHFGLWINRPTIGCAKSLLVGSYAGLGEARGSTANLVDAGEVVGAALRTREGVSPVFVSIGHRVSLATAVRTVLACTPRLRLPEPLRQAHVLVNRMRVVDASAAETDPR
jgi:deoxyribonuclease V